MSKTDTPSRAGMIRAMFAASDGGDIEGLLSFLTDDVVLVFGNADAVHGKAAVAAQASQVTSRLKGVRHEIHDIWQAAEDADVIIARMTVHYSRLDGIVVSLPCCNIFRMSGDLIADYRIYMDVNPVFA
jgi:ketosteroid isomerase-like protein